MLVSWCSRNLERNTTDVGSAWTTKPIKQDVVYDDRAAVEKALEKLERLPPLVTPTEVSTSSSGIRGLRD